MGREKGRNELMIIIPEINQENLRHSTNKIYIKCQSQSLCLAGLTDYNDE